MFDYSLLHWMTFFGVAFALAVSPRPDIALMLGETVSCGRRAGFAAMPGIWTGAGVHVVVAAVGLSTLLATSAMAFSVVKWVGAASLIWLGLWALRQSGGQMVAKVAGRASPAAIFRQGVLVTVLNPRVAIFFLAFLPQFVVPGAGPVWAQLALHGMLIIAVAAVIEPPLILAAHRIADAVNTRPSIAVWIDRALGTLLVALGLRLATTTLKEA